MSELYDIARNPTRRQFHGRPGGGEFDGMDDEDEFYDPLGDEGCGDIFAPLC
jgi:hypothetical protein